MSTVARQVAEFALTMTSVLRTADSSCAATQKSAVNLLTISKQLLDSLAVDFDDFLMSDFMAEYAETVLVHSDPGQAAAVFFNLYNKLVESTQSVGEAYIYLQRAVALSTGTSDW